MKAAVYILAAALLGAVVAWVLIRQSDVDSPEQSGEQAQADASGAAAGAQPRPTPDRSAAPPVAVPPGMPQGLPKPISPEKVFADFVIEENLTQDEAEKLFAGLSESDQELFAMFDQSRFSGELDGKPPVMPMLEEIEAHRVGREAMLVEVLGEEGYDRFTAFSATLPLRGAIKGLRSKGVNIDPDDLKSILTGAYDSALEGSHRSPQEYQQALINGVLDLSQEHLDEAELGKLEKALNENSLMPPALPAVPMPPTLPGADLPALPPGIPPPPGLQQPAP